MREVTNITHSPKKSFSLFAIRGFTFLLGLLAILAVIEGRPLAGSPSEVTRGVGRHPFEISASLELGKFQERNLAGGESHLYEIKISSEQFLRLLVEQRGIDVSVSLLGPDGKTLREVNNNLGERGGEVVSMVANASGTYRVEVRSVRKTDTLGIYQIKLDRLHQATEENRAIDAAEHLIAEANKLRARPTRELLLQAIAKYQASLPLLESTTELQVKAVVLNLLGRSYFSLGEYQKALDYHHKALPLAQAASDIPAEAATLTFIGDGYRLTSEHEKAVRYLTQALQGWQSIQDRRGEIGALNILARVYYQMGDQYKALFSFDQALQLSRNLSDQSLEVDTLGGMGLSYYVLAENEKAAEIWTQELAIIRRGVQPGREANVLSMLGGAHNALGKTTEALEYLNQAIKLARDKGDRVREAGSLQTIARVYRSIGEPRKSIEYLEQSLVVLKDVNHPPTSVARAHYNLGKAYTDLGEYQKAVDYLNQALLVWKSRNDPMNIASTIRELARAERGRGNLETALAQSETALNLIELLRSRAGGPEARATYLASVQDYFELKVDLLTRLHKLDPSKNFAADALQTTERARARSLLETLAAAGMDIRQGVPAYLLKRERTIADELSAKASEQARLAGMKSSERRLAAVNKELKEISAQYKKVEAQIRAESPRYAKLIQPEPMGLTEIREQVLDNQTLLLEYYLGQERSYLWAVTSTSIEIYDLPKQAAIETVAREVYDLFTARNRRVKFETTEERRARIATADANYARAALELSRIILGPVSKQLGTKRLLIVGDGALQYVPFAALPLPRSTSYEPLAATNEVVNLPSASTLAVLRREVAKHKPVAKTIAVLADPVFNEDDERVKEALARNKEVPSGSALAARRSATVSRIEIQRSASESGWDGEALSMTRLPFTRREADAIAALVPAAYRKQQLDFAASLSNATSGELSEYRIVHFATHGFLNSRHPELSGIVLSLIDEKGREQDGFLRAHEIYDLTIPAELVVLSGCRTGLGKEIRGEGLIGLTRAFMHAGAARVMVSLWDVNDEATAELMTRFYGGLLGREKLSPAAALRAAQVSMSRDKRWASPYYWAGFTLQGEPR